MRVIKSRKMRWAAHVVLMVEGRGVYRISAVIRKEETTGKTQVYVEV
jgi:hypothetical protein